MKKLSFVLFLCISLGVKAGGVDSTVKAVGDSATKLGKILMPDSTKLTWLKVYEDTKEGIASLGKTLKVPAEHVYAVLVKQQVVYAISWLLCIIIVTLLLYLTIKFYKVHPGLYEDEDGEINPLVVFTAIPIIALLVLWGISIAHIDTIVGGLINPEYGAIQDIWNFVKY